MTVRRRSRRSRRSEERAAARRVLVVLGALAGLFVLLLAADLIFGDVL